MHGLFLFANIADSLMRRDRPGERKNIMSKVKTVLIGIAIAISVITVGLIDGSDYTHEVNAQTENEAYKAFCSEGLIDGKHLYSIDKFDVNEDGICTTYKLTVKYGSCEKDYYYDVEFA